MRDLVRESDEYLELHDRHGKAGSASSEHALTEVTNLRRRPWLNRFGSWGVFRLITYLAAQHSAGSADAFTSSSSAEAAGAAVADSAAVGGLSAGSAPKGAVVAPQASADSNSMLIAMLNLVHSQLLSLSRIRAYEEASQKQCVDHASRCCFVSNVVWNICLVCIASKVLSSLISVCTHVWTAGRLRAEAKKKLALQLATSAPKAEQKEKEQKESLSGSAGHSDHGLAHKHRDDIHLVPQVSIHAGCQLSQRSRM